MVINVQLIKYFFCVDDLHKPEKLGDVKLSVIECAKTGLVQFLIKNLGLVTEVHMTNLVEAMKVGGRKLQRHSNLWGRQGQLSGMMEKFPEMGSGIGCNLMSLSKDPAGTTGTWSNKVRMVLQELQRFSD
jgi:hypothetical protein